jgi:hypothetical protein
MIQNLFKRKVFKTTYFIEVLIDSLSAQIGVVIELTSIVP